MYQKIWTPHVGEKATTVRESGNEHDRFTVAVVKDEMLCTVCGESLIFLGRLGPLFVCFVGGSALGFHDIGNGASFMSLLKFTHFLLVFAFIPRLAT